MRAFKSLTIALLASAITDCGPAKTP